MLRPVCQVLNSVQRWVKITAYDELTCHSIADQMVA